MMVKTLRMVRLYPIGKQVQNFFVNFPGVLANVQKLVGVGLKAGHQGAVLKHLVFAPGFVVVKVLTYLKMVNRLI
jgi:hypothetical protein